MANEVVYVVVIGPGGPMTVQVAKSLGDALKTAQDVADMQLAENVTLVEVNTKDAKAMQVCASLVEGCGLTPLAMEMGAKQSARQLRMQMGETMTATINPALR